MEHPFVSLVIVNYNGKDLLGPCLQSLQNLDYPTHKYEVIVVDNHSRDNSVEFLQKHFPEVKVITHHTNAGFSGGNNIGIRQAQGKYVALLNSDTVVDPHWLSSLVKRIEQDNNIAAVNGKSLLAFPFLTLHIQSTTSLKSDFTFSIDFAEVGVAVEKVFLENRALQSLVDFRSGFHVKEKKKNYRWTNGHGQILIPVDPHQEYADFSIVLRAERQNSDITTDYTLQLGSTVLQSGQLPPSGVQQCHFRIPIAHSTQDFVWQVQNAGNVIFHDGFARDRGAEIIQTTNRYEIDNPFFDKPKQILAFCGNNVLLRKDIFLQLGGFDERFFLYYEDTELSARIVRHGYTIFYEPSAVLHHYHAATAEEWSSFFRYHVLKNQLAFLCIHFPWRIFLLRFGKLLAITVLFFIRTIRWKFTNHWDVFDKVKAQFLLYLSLIQATLSLFPDLLRTRIQLEKQNILKLHDYQKFLD